LVSRQGRSQFSSWWGREQDRLLFCGSRQLELSLKSRGGKNGIEIRGLISTSEFGQHFPPFVGPIEIWSKWTSNSLNLNSQETIRIEKRRWIRKFDTSAECPREIELDRAEKPATGQLLPESGCNVEFTALSLAGHRPWWTLGFEAFGSFAGVTQSLQAVASLMVSRNPPQMPTGLRCSYPQWLAKCIWPRPTKVQMATVISSQPVREQIGPFLINGYLYVAEPSADSFLEGTVMLGDFFDRRFLVFLDGQPVCVEVGVGMENLSFCIKFDPVSREFVGVTCRCPNETEILAPELWQSIIAMH
jgi:hypothetical protein